ncbi:hypothetical protein K493DRAFT_21824 [Basidiobolus meristosporus CBS 931.73]|uniref:TPR-like protein n=1 Tax=Basidiobolus meristosporus CBS 931.73 TaxID=1314790 RepID=A0A1Y1YE85_9FUNG|nr:hypothetical protein K493DRAFT_21824 [Basidiobolus meristosporus CBS 931.73]|eukprot:ORX96006.1 hypothetical protein K493DRAFT_21824 [Basidiobolus meristosporus CBS 931.73]
MLRGLARRSALLNNRSTLSKCVQHGRRFSLVRPLASAVTKKALEARPTLLKTPGEQVLESSASSALHAEIKELVYNNASPTLESFHQALKSCAAAGDLNSALEVLTSMYSETTRSVTPSFETYQLLLETAKESADVDLTIFLVKSVLEGRAPVAYSSGQQPEVALNLSEFTAESLELNLDVWESCLSALVSPSKIWSDDYGRLGTEALWVLQKMKEVGVRSFNENIWGLFIRTLGCTGSEASIPGVLHQLLASDEAMTPSIYAQAICAYSRCGNLPKALELYDEMVSIYGASPYKEPLWALAMNTSKAGDFANTKKLALAAQNLDAAHSSEKRSYDFTPHLLRVSSNAIRKKTGVNSEKLISHWDSLIAEVEESGKLFDKEYFGLYLEGHGCMNLLDAQKYPIDHIKRMLQSTGNLTGLEAYQAAIASYARTGECAEKPKFRLQRILEIGEMMKAQGLEFDATVYYHMFEACLPHQVFAYGPESNITSIKNASLDYDFDWSVYDVERMMMKQGIAHNRKTLLAMFYGFAFGGQYESIKRRWRELSLSRVHRDRDLYTSLVSILKEDYKEAIYALTVVRHQMSRESPPIEPDANLFSAAIRLLLANKGYLSHP